MPIRANRNIEVLEPLLLMSATAVDAVEADLAVEGAAPENNPFDAFGSLADEVENLAEGFEQAVFAELDDLSAFVRPVQAEPAAEGFAAPQSGFEGIDLNQLVDSFSEAAENQLTIATIPPIPEANLPPVAVHDYNYTPAGETVSGSVLCNDVDPNGDCLTAWVNCAPANGTLQFHSDGTYTYTPNADFTGVDTFNYVVSDGNGGCSSTSVSIEVGEPVDECGNSNSTPSAVDDVVDTDFESAVTGNLLDNDLNPDGETLQAWVETGPTSGSIDLAQDGSYTYTPDPGFSGTDTFTYSVNDAEGNTSIATVTVNIGPAPVNQAPVANDDAESTAFETEFSGNVLVNDSDPEGDQILAWVEEGPTSGSIQLGPDGAYIYTPDPGFSGTDTFTYSVTDTEGNCSIATVTIEVGPAPVNEGPTAVNDTATTGFETSVSGNVLTNDSDPEGDALQAWVETGPSNGSIEMSPDGNYVYTPIPGFSGTDSFTYSVNDVYGNSTIATVTIEVGEPAVVVDDGPVAVDDAASGFVGTEITGDVITNDSDPDGGQLSVAPISDFVTVEGGTVLLKEDGTFSYQPAEGYSGFDSFTYELIDSEGARATATVAIEVKPLPIGIQDDTYTILNGENAITGDVTTNDGVDGNVIVQLVSGPTNGALVLAEDGTFEYQADPGFSGQDSFDYLLIRCDQTSEVATASIIVSRVQYDTSHQSTGKGWVWGDPHFKGEDGGFYDVQGESGKTYSLLSDNDLQVNALFIPWELHEGSNMMGAIGITSASDQIVADLQETRVNGVVIEAGQTIELENCTVTYDGQYTTVTTSEYELELNRRSGWYDMKLESLDPFSDNVAPHGLWGLTVDADTDPRDGDFYKNDGWDYSLQGGGAIDTINAAGEIVRTEKGDRTAYKLYETADLLSVEALNAEAANLFRFAAAEGTGLSPI